MNCGYQKPSIKYLHIWDCLANAGSYRPNENKLDFRTISYYFVGYTEWLKDFKFYDPSIRTFLRWKIRDSLRMLSLEGEISPLGMLSLNKNFTLFQVLLLTKIIFLTLFNTQIKITMKYSLLKIKKLLP